MWACKLSFIKLGWREEFDFEIPCFSPYFSLLALIRTQLSTWKMTFVQSAESNFKKLLGRYHKQSFLPSPSFCGLTLLFVGTLNSHSRQEKHLRFFTLKPTVVYLIPLEATSHAMRCTRGNCKKKTTTNKLKSLTIIQVFQYPYNCRSRKQTVLEH